MWEQLHQKFELRKASGLASWEAVPSSPFELNLGPGFFTGGFGLKGVVPNVSLIGLKMTVSGENIYIFISFLETKFFRHSNYRFFFSRCEDDFFSIHFHFKHESETRIRDKSEGSLSIGIA